MERLRVIATDRGNPSLSSAVPVQIQIRRVHPHPPKWSRPLSWWRRPFPVPVDAAPELRVARVEAVAASINEGVAVSYFIVGGNGSSIFGVDKKDGWVTVIRSLNAGLSRVGTVFTLELQASIGNKIGENDDNILASPKRTMTFLLTSANKYAPLFSSSKYERTVSENYPSSRTILQVLAHDSDYGVNGVVSYSIESGNDAGLISIDADTGEIRAAPEKTLDYELTTEINLRVKATDGGFNPKKAFTDVRVKLTDVNDSPPVFDRYSFTTITTTDNNNS